LKLFESAVGVCFLRETQTLSAYLCQFHGQCVCLFKLSSFCASCKSTRVHDYTPKLRVASIVLMTMMMMMMIFGR